MRIPCYFLFYFNLFIMYYIECMRESDFHDLKYFINQVYDDDHEFLRYDLVIRFRNDVYRKSDTNYESLINFLSEIKTVITYSLNHFRVLVSDYDLFL